MTKKSTSCDNCFDKNIWPEIYINKYNDDHSLFFNQIDKIDKLEIKRLTKSICKAYKAGYINEGLFEELIEYLLAFFIEFTIQEKFANKTSHLNNKLSKLSVLHFLKYESAR